jgi:ribonucleoside-diphosphate reductase alpha chain
MSSIFGNLKNMALIQKSGGGTGFSFSRLRPKNDLVSTTKGKSSGPVSFMRLYDYACEVTRLGGVRSGANMGVMRCDHPDILEFVDTKLVRDTLQTFNISVAVTTLFMNCVRESSEYPIINPRTQRVVGHLNARAVFDKIVAAAWRTGDPGLLFIDRINEANPTKSVAEIEATNPCGEQPLLPYESCVLGSINLAKFVTPDGKIDEDRLGNVARLGVRFLDDVVDANRYPIKEIEDATKANRKIGLGVMGFADLLLLLCPRIRYDSDEAIETAKQLMSVVSEQARLESSRLAEIKGDFPNHSKSVFSGIRLRNAGVTTVAPTGTISLLANCSSGIEPLFALSYGRQMFGELSSFEINPILEESAGPYLDADLRRRIAETGSVSDVAELPDELRKAFVTAHEISWKWHVRMQAAFQDKVDSAVSKTVNLPNSATLDDVRGTYLLADELGCKGITVFRDHCRDDQVLSVGSTSTSSASATQACPECGGPMVHASGCVNCASCGYTFCNL